MNSEDLKHPRYVLAPLGVFLIIGLAIFISDWFENNAIANNPKNVEGVVMWELPYHWKRMDYICFQYQVGGKLYIGKAVGGGLMKGYFPGQKCLIVYDGDNPEHSRVTGLLPQSGEVVSKARFKGEVILLDGECPCEIGGAD